MSIAQLDDPSVKDALGFSTTPSGDPTLAYTNNGETSTLRVGSVANTVPITSVPILSYNSPSVVQVNPLPINIIIDPPPPASPLNNVTVAEFHWYKQDPNPILNQDKKGYIKLGDGVFKLGAEWVGQGPETVFLEGANLVCASVGAQNGSIGLELQGGASTNPVVAPQSASRFWLDTTGQLNTYHSLPLTSVGNQVLFRPTYCEAISTANTPVGAGGQVILPLNSITSSTQGGVNHFAIVGGNSVRLSATNANAGVFFVTATIAIDTTTGGTNTAYAHFKVNGNDVANSASSHSINQNQQNSIVIQSFLTLNPNDAVSVALSSTDAAMTATTYPAVVGPPTIPQECAVVLVLTRIA